MGRGVRILAVALLGAAVAAAGNRAILFFYGKDAEAFPFLDPYLLHQYLYRYGDLGFERRALIGTLLDLPRDSGVVWQVYAVAGGLVLAAGALAALRLDLRREPFLAALLLLSPATFLQWGSDFGRFDGLLLLGSGLVLAARHPAALLGLPVLVLIHEGAAAISAPLLAAAHIARFGPDRWLVASVGLTAAAMLAFALGTPQDPSRLRALYPLAEQGPEILARPLLGAPGEMAGRVSHWFARMTEAPPVIALFVLVGGYLLFLLRVAAGRMGPGAWRGLILLCAFGPLALAPVTLDTMRWVALSAGNLLLLALLPPVRAVRPPRRPSAFDWAVVAGFAVLGPFGIGWPFPVARKLLALLLA